MSSPDHQYSSDAVQMRSLPSTGVSYDYINTPNTTGTITITTNGTGPTSGWGITLPNVTQPIFNPNIQPSIQILPNPATVPMPAPTYVWEPPLTREEVKILVKEALMEMFAQLLVPAERD